MRTLYNYGDCYKDFMQLSFSDKLTLDKFHKAHNKKKNRRWKNDVGTYTNFRMGISTCRSYGSKNLHPPDNISLDDLNPPSSQHAVARI